MEARNLPPAPDEAKRAKNAADEDEIELTEADIISESKLEPQEIPDLTDEAEDISEHGSPEVRENMMEIQRIEEERVGEKETLRAAHEALKLSEDTGKYLKQKNQEINRGYQEIIAGEAAEEAQEKKREEEERLEKIAKARQELKDLGMIPQNPDAALQEHTKRMKEFHADPVAFKKKEAQERLENEWFQKGEAESRAAAEETADQEAIRRVVLEKPPKVKDERITEEEAAVFRMKGERRSEGLYGALGAEASKDLDDMERRLMADYGVDMNKMARAGYVARAALETRMLFNPGLRKAIGEYRKIRKTVGDVLDSRGQQAAGKRPKK